MAGASFGNVLKNTALSALSQVASSVREVYDLGAGQGTWRKLARNHRIGGRRWVAVEVYEPYVARFDLRKIYDRVWVKDIRHINYGGLPGRMFIFGDVLEHLEQAEAEAVVRKAASAGTVVVMMPFLPTLSEVQGALDGNEHERHRHVWEWPAWLAFLTTLTGGCRLEVLEPRPDGTGRNKGCTITWHAAHQLQPQPRITIGRGIQALRRQVGSR